ncbi:hypothetical protein [Oceanirhabdus sp. W0125-5]|uniref:hypothetical protein n=1 Tax=Oceanirhabdus sp. W0125-5 TaxID=2999116 RepID=UPI0022F2BA00|nr:hypothetical protein [Oceanirhabdus sp. W0125-5]WBW97899.1 hypothetical protein OW730_03715 [Oceanirhabdus sp. W0125-5]
MRVFIHENKEKNKELKDGMVYKINKSNEDIVYILNKKSSKYIYIIYSIQILPERLKNKRIQIFNNENMLNKKNGNSIDKNLEWVAQRDETLETEKLLLVNSIFEKEYFSDILLDKYIIIIPGGGIAIKLDSLNDFNIIYKKQKI